MPEVARAGEDHRHAFVVRGLNDLGVTHRPTWLDGSRGTGFGCGDESIGKREKGVATDHATFQRQTGFLGFPNSNTGGVHPRHLAGADAEGSVARGIYDGVRLYMLHNQ